MTDKEYMEEALRLASKGEGYTSPNPMVGAVIVKDDEIIGHGFHKRYGDLHAERNALIDCKENPKGACMYVTLEPCCHYGKTPPCTEAIIGNGIAKVVIGSMDPNPLVAGKGAEILRKAGIIVEIGLLEEKCLELNRAFFSYISEGKPFVAMKYAMTLDGKIATYSGKSKWITGEKAREHVHQLRHKYSGIMVGIGTVLKDDPMLNCRLGELKNPKNPIRIVCDTNLRIPLSSQIVATANQIETVIAMGIGAGEPEKKAKLEEAGCKLLEIPIKGAHLDLELLIQRLAEEGIVSILLEGGGNLNYEALKCGIVDYIYTYISPKIFGGDRALTPVEGQGVGLPEEAFRLKRKNMLWLGEDLLLEQEVIKEEGYVHRSD